MSENISKNEFQDSLSAKKTNFYPNHPLENEIETKVEELKNLAFQFQELKPFLEELTSLPWKEYEERLSQEYLNKFTFVKEESIEQENFLESAEDERFSIQEPIQILAKAKEELGLENDAYTALSTFISNRIALAMQRGVSIALKKNL
ncbi:hypothetical protein [Leptospira stimsonii]|uniref:Uncharacterized protein n=1 Tax=Leptospira stimsonii TaxID=2202203 RepID=A0A4R9L7W1_9LEPT|nr:hypothetical protein [Leptospira stimsonii]RHX88013.1 hypothetical protein DLM78_03355 [Leptospira stimsonii]TGK23722.1 hypothetical protein EHO98_03415 [Leptospira stimsonii]TGM17498.1 hypothetical protein EHQ90_06830 [Leptospira stimsonii]